MNKKIELAYSRALVPIKGKINKTIAICISIVVVIALTIFMKI